jgi:hypothetical protein
MRLLVLAAWIVMLCQIAEAGTQPDFAYYSRTDDLLHQVRKSGFAVEEIAPGGRSRAFALGVHRRSPYRHSCRVAEAISRLCGRQAQGWVSDCMLRAHDHQFLPAALFVFGEHGRELITSEVALRLVTLFQEPASDLVEFLAK